MTFKGVIESDEDFFRYGDSLGTQGVEGTRQELRERQELLVSLREVGLTKLLVEVIQQWS
jgi:hypothetical protein